jgi:poly-gamma-glutamate synthesis protein (capsule biosynthesis protein)
MKYILSIVILLVAGGAAVSIWKNGLLGSKTYPVISAPVSTPATTSEPTLPYTNQEPQFPFITTIDQIFNPETASTSPATKSNTVISLMATGDVLLARSINYKMVQLQDFTWPFVYVSSFLESADLTYINLETPLISDCPTRVDGMFFCGDLRGIDSLKFAGIDVVNVANNHASNFGPEGVAETHAALETNNFVTSGISDDNVGFTTVKDTKFAFLGYNEVNEQPGVTTATDETVQREVAAARSQADVVVVQFHWGNEYTYTPSENQKRLARLAVDSGADLIIGNHPHWYQPIEFYKGKLITYSHGNLVFDQMWSRETREGIVGEYYFQNKQLVGVRFHPVLIENYGQPKLLEGIEAMKILDNLKAESYSLHKESATP